MILAEQAIAEYLRKKDVGTDPVMNGPWPIYVGRLPQDPDAAIAIHRDLIPTEGRIHNTGETINHEGLQIRVRHKQYLEAQKKTLEICQVLDRLVREQVSVETTLYRIQCVNRFVTPFFLGPDPTNRVSFTINCTASIQEI